MNLVINLDACLGCGACVKYCPGHVLELDETDGRPYEKYPQDCWYCGVCQVECPAAA